MSQLSLRRSVPVRALVSVRAALARLATPPLPPELPTHEQLQERRAYGRHVAASPHFLAVGGRIDVIRIPR